LSPFGEAARLRPENGLAKTGVMGVWDIGGEIVSPNKRARKDRVYGVCDPGREITAPVCRIEGRLLCWRGDCPPSGRLRAYAQTMGSQRQGLWAFGILAWRLSPFGEAARLRPENGLAKTGVMGVCVLAGRAGR